MISRSSLKLLERLHRPSNKTKPVNFTSALSRSALPDVNSIVESVPISWIQQGRIRKSDIVRAKNFEYNPWNITEKLKAQIREADLALAATTPVLGQYAPTFGWADDWGWYWEYLDAYLFVPEVSYAVKLKTRQVWKPGFEFETSSDTLTEKIRKEWNRRKIFQSLFEATKNALIWGNSYIESVDNSEAVWEEGTPADIAQGAASAYTPGANPNITYAPRPVKIEKVIQRRWSGPLAPTAILGSETELDFHPEQMLLLQFNKISGGIYGYSTFRETLFVLKGYLLMLQFLPGIVNKRADATVHFRVGANKFAENGQQVTTIPTQDEIQNQKALVESRAPGEDVWTDILTDSKELHSSTGGTERVNELLQYYKERVMMGLGIPLTAATLSKGGAEVKFGDLSFELMEDETREHQQKEEDLVNDYILPRLLLNLRPGRKLGDGPEAEIQLNVN